MLLSANHKNGKFVFSGVARYYFDTCVWRDFYESRIGLHGKPLGKYASDLFLKVISRKDVLLYSDLIVKELRIDYDEKEVADMLNFLFLASVLERVEAHEEEHIEAQRLAEDREIPAHDALHAILSRNNNAVFVSQDEHAQILKDVVVVKKPEEII